MYSPSSGSGLAGEQVVQTGHAPGRQRARDLDETCRAVHAPSEHLERGGPAWGRRHPSTAPGGAQRMTNSTRHLLAALALNAIVLQSGVSCAGSALTVQTEFISKRLSASREAVPRVRHSAPTSNVSNQRSASQKPPAAHGHIVTNRVQAMTPRVGPLDITRYARHRSRVASNTRWCSEAARGCPRWVARGSTQDARRAVCRNGAFGMRGV